jgi:AcrR family transcriptional regulator
MQAFEHVRYSRSAMPKTLTSAQLKPRKSPRQARSAETVQIVLEAAARILESRGRAGFTTNAVAERAGVSIGSLYQYFPSKEALTGALIERETTILLEEATVALEAKTGYDALQRLIAAAVKHQFRRPALALILDFEESRWPLAKDIRQVADRLRAMLQKILTLPDLPPQQNIDVAAADIFAMVKGMIDAAGERGEFDRQDFGCRDSDCQDLEQRVARAVFGYLRDA